MPRCSSCPTCAGCIRSTRSCHCASPRPALKRCRSTTSGAPRPPPRGADFDHNPHVEQTLYATVRRTSPPPATARRARCAGDLQRRLLLRRTAVIRARYRPEVIAAGVIGFYGIVDRQASDRHALAGRQRAESVARCWACSVAPTRECPQASIEVPAGSRRGRCRQRAGHLSRRAAFLLRPQGGGLRRRLGRRLGADARVRARDPSAARLIRHVTCFGGGSAWSAITPAGAGVKPQASMYSGRRCSSKSTWSHSHPASFARSRAMEISRTATP